MLRVEKKPIDLSPSLVMQWSNDSRLIKRTRCFAFYFEWECYAMSASIRPSSGREHNYSRITYMQSGDDDDYLMNESSRKPTTGTRCPTLFDKWDGIFYMPSRADTAGHAKAFIYPVMDHRGEVKVFRHKTDSNRRPVSPQSNTPTTRPR